MPAPAGVGDADVFGCMLCVGALVAWPLARAVAARPPPSPEKAQDQRKAGLPDVWKGRT